MIPRAEAQSLAGLLRGQPVHVAELDDRTLPVGQLAKGLPVSRPAVSQHLKVLKEAGLVAEDKDGTRRIYRIDPHGLARLRAWLDQFWESALDAFKAQAEQSDDEGNTK